MTTDDVSHTQVEHGNTHRLLHSCLSARRLARLHLVVSRQYSCNFASGICECELPHHIFPKLLVAASACGLRLLQIYPIPVLLLSGIHIPVSVLIDTHSQREQFEMTAQN